uniref:Uncharacterized protein ycf20 n=1 Tax=Gracilariopsis chorda TaxID=448386 RepID=A0A1C9CEZ6_9FLOR|nr:hypothetical protein Gch_073 [Gracilariopsis chorda]AOM66932.1 hypothetical protein Gch_073 [Gracilariopsis chorda]UAD88806.1 hypothetical protein [Gracilariopsis chorda]
MNKKFTYITIQLICLFLGFFLSTVFSTIPSQTGDWGIIAGSIIVTFNEIISKYIYQYKKKYNTLFFLYIINFIRVGIIYGLFVDAFKLGS